MLDLRAVFEEHQQELPVSLAIATAEEGLWGKDAFVSSVCVTGSVKKTGGLVLLDCNAGYMHRFICDRCGSEVYRSVETPVRHVLVRELAGPDEEELVVAKGGFLDIDELVRTDILLALPISSLCSDDCKGLCQSCGCNLNEKSCDCAKDTGSKKSGPFSALSELY